jgi:hypothetical protein
MHLHCCRASWDDAAGLLGPRPADGDMRGSSEAGAATGRQARGRHQKCPITEDLRLSFSTREAGHIKVLWS